MCYGKHRSFSPTARRLMCSASSVAGSIRVSGARVHNLQGVDVEIPRNALVALTGVSGSGKSSLAFDVIFAEGQRRYLQSLTPGQRGLPVHWERADVDLVEGLPPAVSIDQRTGTAAARSTLATTTEINNYLRLLYARTGTVHCPGCDRPVARRTPRAIVDLVLQLGAKRRVMLLAPIVQNRRGAQADVFLKLAREGLVRARVDGELIEVAEPPELDRHRSHNIDAVVDRIVVRDGLQSRLQESVELALRVGQGRCLVSVQEKDGWKDTLYSSRLACAECEWSAPEVEPRTFSFNSPEGACPACRGLGRIEIQEGDELVETGQVCDECGGTRLGPLARSVKIGDVTMPTLVAMTVTEAAHCVGRWKREPPVESGPRRAVLERVLPHVSERLEFLERVGLEYLTLDRPTRTLSGGEYQRARLAGALGSGLIGVLYILDEPTIGLHAADASRLIDCLEDLRARGNSVIVVEHDLGVLRRSEWVVDLGPGGGRGGGEVVVAGTVDQVAACRESVTGKYLREGPSIPVRQPRDCGSSPAVRISGATCHNLDNLSIEFPLGVLCAVTGVSGSGKTSLVGQTLVPLLQSHLKGAAGGPEGVTLQWCGDPAIERVVAIDQSPVGRSSRSTPATLTKIWDEIRKVFASTRDARSRGFRARRFSFNVQEGRCAHCRGRGSVVVEMQFLPEMEITCPDCQGGRFNAQTLRVRYRGLSVADVLEMSAAEALVFFENFPKVSSLLQTLVDVGLGYLVLGQSTATLSGGEAQRVRLATELGRPRRGATLYVLDEPTTGLHAHDVDQLLKVLDRLVESGHSVIIIEHHPELIARADWVIDLGPGGGQAGGRLVACGTPQQVATDSDGPTGRILKTLGLDTRPLDA